MRRLLLGFVLLLMACQVFTPGIHNPTPFPSFFDRKEPEPYLQTAPADPTTATAAAAAEAQPAQDLFAVHFHPDGPLYVGDQVSLEVVAPAHFNSAGKKVLVSLEQPGSSTRLGEAGFGYYGIGGRLQATLQWIWDTSALSPGEYTLRFTLDPDGLQWSQPVVLHPSSQAPSAELGAHWAVASTDCCQLHYITGTRAERDLPLLQEIVDEQASELSQRLGVQIDKPIDITFVPRVVGQGGFTSQEIAVSYPERDYLASDIGIVVKHELVHALDARLGGDLRPSLLAEGLAVYLVGGHFKPEPLRLRAAVLLPPLPGCMPTIQAIAARPGLAQVCSLGGYQPLSVLADQFYTTQHEIGYLEAGALVDYIMRTYGWQAFSAFYRDIHPYPSGSQAGAIQVALQKHFGVTLEELDQNFQADLSRQALDPRQVLDVRLSIEYYDAIRRYQQYYDPSAYFLTAWLPEASQMRQRGIVTDSLRSPDSPVNIILENLLGSAGKSLEAGDYAQATRILATESYLIARLPLAAQLTASN